MSALRLSPLQRVPPYAVRTDVLPPTEHAELLGWVLANEALFRESRVTAGYDPSRRSARSIAGDHDWAARIVPLIDALVPDVERELGVAPFEQGGFEIEVVAYGDGGFIEEHRDTGTREWRHPQDRYITMVYYLHREPKGYEGGELRLRALNPGPDGSVAYVDLPPLQNAIIAFPGWALHEVLPVSVPSQDYEDSRFAINFWVRRRYG